MVVIGGFGSIVDHAVGKAATSTGNTDSKSPTSPNHRAPNRGIEYWIDRLFPLALLALLVLLPWIQFSVPGVPPGVVNSHGPMRLLAVLVVGVALPLIVGAASLQVKGIAFAMVTLAFARAVAITVARNPGNETGGEEGLPPSRDGLPDMPGQRCARTRIESRF